MKRIDIIAIILCLLVGVGAWVYLDKYSKKIPVISSFRTIITETYFERDKEQTSEQFMEIVNNFSRKMEHPGRKLTIKIYSDIQVGGIVGVLLITEEMSK